MTFKNPSLVPNYEEKINKIQEEVELLKQEIENMKNKTESGKNNQNINQSSTFDDEYVINTNINYNKAKLNGTPRMFEFKPNKEIIDIDELLNNEEILDYSINENIPEKAMITQNNHRILYIPNSNMKDNQISRN